MAITRIGPWIKIVYGIATSTSDVVTDVLAGLHHNQVKNVTRYFGNSTMAPDNCFFTYNNFIERMSVSSVYSVNNFVILTKDFFGPPWHSSRKECFVKMMAASIIWLIINISILIGLMVWVGLMDESTHLPHWSEPRFAFHGHPTLFFVTTTAIILMGPVSIFFLWRLKHQVKALAVEENKMDAYWGVDK